MEKISIFDTVLTLALKYAVERGVPSSSVITEEKEEQTVQFLNELSFPSQQQILDFLRSYTYSSVEEKIKEALLVPGVNILKAISDLALKYNDITTLNFIMYTYNWLRDNNIVEFLPILNGIMYQLGLIGFTGLQDFTSQYQVWNMTNIASMERDRKNHDFLGRFQQELAAISPEPTIVFSPIRVNRSTIIANVSLRAKQGSIPADPLYAIDIFNSSNVNLGIPAVHYGKKEENYYRIFTPVDSTLKIRYNYFLDDELKREKDNKTEIIEYAIWNGTGDPSSASKGSYSSAIYNIPAQQITVDIPIIKSQTVEKVIADLSNSTPLIFSNIKQQGVKGEFNVYNIILDDITFLDMITNEDLFNIYIYVDESKIAYPNKRKLRYHFRTKLEDIEKNISDADDQVSKTSMTFSIKQAKTKEHDHANILINNVSSIKLLPPNVNFIRVKVYRGMSRIAIQQFMLIFYYLLTYYQSKRPALIQQYQSLTGVVIDPMDFVIEKKKKKEKDSGTLRQLRQIAPHIFATNYSRTCQAPFQPLIIQEDEIEYWEKQRPYRDGNQWRQRPILRFPQNETPNYLFVCPNDAVPIPGPTPNNIGLNKDKYPFVPCCSKNPKVIKEKRGGTGLIKTNKILAPERPGVLPDEIVDIMESGVESLKEEAESDFVRYGVVKSPNSFIHCVLAALNWDNYQARDDREVMARAARLHISKYTQPSLYSAEMFDSTDAQISQKMANMDEFYDPLLFYRGVENIFNVNIFIFQDKKKEDKKAKEKEVDNNVVLFPRYAKFPLKNKIERDVTICIIRNRGAEADNLVYPQCELIIQRKSGASILSFDRKLGNFLNNFHNESIRIYHYVINLTGKLVDIPMKYLTPNVTLFLSSLLGKNPLSQIIDSEGKLRGLNFDTITLIIPPSVPENLPRGEQKPTNLIDAVKTFGDPFAIDLSSSKKLIGLWYRILDSDGEIDIDIYIPIVEIDLPEILSTKKVYEPNPLQNLNKSSSIISDYHRKRKGMDILLSLLLYLFQYWTGTQAQFIIDNFINAPADIPLLLSQLWKVPRILKSSTSFDEAKKYVQSFIPAMFIEGRMSVLDAKFYEGFNYFLLKYQKSYFVINRVVEIPRYYETVKDFRTTKDSVVLVGKESFTRWYLNMMDIRGNPYEIKKIVEKKFSESISPYWIRSVDGQIYLIQNVAADTSKNLELRRALAIAITWRNSRENLGYGAEPAEGDILPLHEIINLTKNNELKIEVKPDVPYLLLQYEDGLFAAVLPFL